MDNDQIKRFALFLFKEKQNKSKQLDEIGKGCQRLHTGRQRTVCRIWTGTHLCRNCWNWADKGAMQLNKLIPALKKIALQDGAFSPPVNPEESRSELMSKALNYLKNFWNQIFAYRNDGEYSIDNLPAERALRPVTVQWKNRLFFGSVKGIQNPAIYNTFVETCKQAGVSFRDYFCKLLRELKKGRTDYENILPHDNMQIIIVKFR